MFSFFPDEASIAISKSLGLLKISTTSATIPYCGLSQFGWQNCYSGPHMVFVLLSLGLKKR